MVFARSQYTGRKYREQMSLYIYIYTYIYTHTYKCLRNETITRVIIEARTPKAPMPAASPAARTGCLLGLPVVSLLPRAGFALSWTQGFWMSAGVDKFCIHSY